MPRIQESAENYLETILILNQRNGSVRSIDVAAELEFSKPSVSVAMKNLREQGCITVDEKRADLPDGKGPSNRRKCLRKAYPVHRVADRSGSGAPHRG